MSSPFLSVREVVKKFGGLRALDEITFDVHEGEMFGVLGPNGAGKTTLLNCISGLLRPDGGEVEIAGVRTEHLKPHRLARMGVGRTLQLAEHFKHFTVIDYVLLGRYQFATNSVWICGMSLPIAIRKEKAEKRYVRDLLERFDLTAVQDVVLSELPYGTQRLVDVVRAIAGEPKLVLLDEPTSGSTEFERQALRGHLSLLREEAITTVVVDHDMRFIADCCGRALAMAHGKLLTVGPVSEVLADAEVVSAYLGRTEVPEATRDAPTLSRETLT
jgi:branched-chain amino acid transport system ATP-binding protein